jgi:quercetin dioxygenase-like cupin family protein
MRTTTLRFILALLPLNVVAAQVKPVWGPAPAVFPAGARMAVMQGDPSKAELFTVRLDMPDGYKIAPHFHPTDEHVTVISGAFKIGMGDSADPTKMAVLKAGDFATAGAQMHHYAVAKGHTIVQVHAMGPFALTYVNAADDPSKKR